MPKKQYVKFFFVYAFFLALAFLLSSHPFRFLRGAAANALLPILHYSTVIAQRFHGGGRREELQAIMKENQSLYAAQFELERMREENQELRRASQFAENADIKFIGADVLSYSQEFGDEFLLINQGEERGIAPGDFAVTHEGMLVGTVKERGVGFAKIGIASNAGEKFVMRIVDPPMNAIARGLGARVFALEFFTSDPLVQRGDFVYTSDEKTSHHPIIIGTVVREAVPGASLQKEARALLFARPELLNTIFIIAQ
ncbi:MAG: rod shape-determining protein MreC [Candidatus Colwellbacteria bacterium]|nr:rod shape-determining protein MreC [Candidatus Colwellbacteria bacterium]